MESRHLFPGSDVAMFSEGHLNRADTGLPPLSMVHQPPQQLQHQHLATMHHPQLGMMHQQQHQHHLPAMHHQLPQSNTHAAQVLAWEAQGTGETPGGRIIGIIRTPNNNGSMYPFPAMTHANHLTPTAYDAHGEPVYSCQGLQPQGPAGRIYQCLGHTQGENILHGKDRELNSYHTNSRYPEGTSEQKFQGSGGVENSAECLDVREHRYSLRNNTVEHVYPQLKYSNSLQHRTEKHNHLREEKVDPRVQILEQSLEDRLNPSVDQRSVYHYSGSDYSSTEPLYMQRYACRSEIGANTPSLTYNSLRTSSRGRGSSRGKRPEFLDRSGSSSNSTASSTLPAVSALLTRNSSANTASGVARGSQAMRVSLPRHSKGGSTVTPTKLKRQGLFGPWKVKFLHGEGSRRKVCLLLSALAFVVLLVLGIIATILYLTFGGDLSFFSGTSSKLVEFTEIGYSVVDGEFVISNHNFQPAFADENSEPFRYIAKSIEHELDGVFSSSPWSDQYNSSRVVLLAPVPLLVQVLIILNSGEDDTAAQKLSSAFLKGLSRRQGQYWLGPYTIDITSVRFSDDLVDSSTFSTLVTTSVSSTNGDTTLKMAAIQPTPYLNVGWGSWGAWSICSPCSPQYDQVRTRQCRLDAGRGLLINTIEPCLPSRMSADVQGSGGDMESRPCQCNHNVDKSDIPITTSSPLLSSFTTEVFISTTTIPAATQLSTSTTKKSTEKNISPYANINDKEHECGWCLPEQVCVSLQDEDQPFCREPLDVTDTSGCGGLCILDSEVCQSTGQPHAFRCQSGSQCLKDEWRCEDGLCIPSSKRCDGHMNCYDRTDELNCENNTSSSNSSLAFSHGSKSGQINSLQYLDDIKSTSSIIADGDVSTQSPTSIDGTPVVMPGMNRTAIGLSSLSHRERELLS